MRSTLLTVAARLLRLDVVRVGGGELLETGNQPAGDEHQHEVTTRIAAMRDPAWIQSTALNH